MPELEEVCRWDMKIPKSEWEKFKSGISDIAKRHGEIPVSGAGRCIGNGFELHAEAKKEEDYFSLAISIRSSQGVPILLIRQLQDYIMNNLQYITDYRASYRNSKQK